MEMSQEEGMHFHFSEIEHTLMDLGLFDMDETHGGRASEVRATERLRSLFEREPDMRRFLPRVHNFVVRVKQEYQGVKGAKKLKLEAAELLREIGAKDDLMAEVERDFRLMYDTMARLMYGDQGRRKSRFGWLGRLFGV